MRTIFEKDCTEIISGNHEQGIKWRLPDRTCYWCHKCGKEIIIFEDNSG
jgi:hypothetical protein